MLGRRFGMFVVMLGFILALAGCPKTPSGGSDPKIKDTAPELQPKTPGGAGTVKAKPD